MKEPLVSVVIAACNQAEHLPRTLRSLKEQTLPSSQIQVIAVNDGSVDGTAEILRSCSDWVETLEQENRGLPASCNVGLQAARGRYFARLDSDDFAQPDWLETLVRALETHPQASCAVPDRMEGDGAVWRTIPAQTENLYSLIACGTLFRTEALRALGGFRSFYWEEYDLYLRLRSQGRFLHVERPLYHYRKHADAMTADADKRRQGWKELTEMWGIQTLRSAGSNPELDQAVR